MSLKIRFDENMMMRIFCKCSFLTLYFSSLVCKNWHKLIKNKVINRLIQSHINKIGSTEIEHELYSGYFLQIYKNTCTNKNNTFTTNNFIPFYKTGLFFKNNCILSLPYTIGYGLTTFSPLSYYKILLEDMNIIYHKNINNKLIICNDNLLILRGILISAQNKLENSKYFRDYKCIIRDKWIVIKSSTIKHFIISKTNSKMRKFLGKDGKKSIMSFEDISNYKRFKIFKFLNKMDMLFNIRCSTNVEKKHIYLYINVRRLIFK